jgi:hypothetical protein
VALAPPPFARANICVAANEPLALGRLLIWQMYQCRRTKALRRREEGRRRCWWMQHRLCWTCEDKVEQDVLTSGMDDGGYMNGEQGI